MKPPSPFPPHQLSMAEISFPLITVLHVVGSCHSWSFLGRFELVEYDEAVMTKNRQTIATGLWTFRSELIKGGG